MNTFCTGVYSYLVVIILLKNRVSVKNSWFFINFVVRNQ